MKLPVHVRRDDDQGTVQVYCPDLPGCSAAAATFDEALAILRKRVSEYFSPSTRRPSAGTRVITIEV